jgi:prepilin-type N-terminal cleavage/methylation domain-containing protein
MAAVLPISKVFRFSKEGFTLIELLVVISILSVLMLITFASFRLFSGQVTLDTTSQQILSTLELARTRTLASKDESQHGVHFETTKYVLFKGSTYSDSDPENKEYNLSSSEIYEINLSGGDDVVFTRVRGTTINNGSIKVRLTADTSKTKTILVNSSGSVSLQETVTPTDTRVTDSRHLHLDLGWSILNSTTLTFVFSDSPNPDVQEDIPMAGFFDAGKTEFDWEGTVDVNGSDQTLRVHTHYLDATDTTLSVHRDGQRNDKAVKISIDGNEIVSYSAAGIATVGGFGGAMTPQ